MAQSSPRVASCAAADDMVTLHPRPVISRVLRAFEYGETRGGVALPVLLGVFTEHGGVYGADGGCGVLVLRADEGVPVEAVYGLNPREVHLNEG